MGPPLSRIRYDEYGLVPELIRKNTARQGATIPHAMRDCARKRALAG